ncbi:MAG: Dabb family protein [Puniceicoccaceae bacterium]
MLVHSVFFWLREDLTSEQRQNFASALHTLSTIESIHAVYIGTPAPTPPRPVIDASYDFALTVIFSRSEDHDRYQEDPVHQQFISENKHLWTKVQIYDAA